jgi:S1-C subfamily serine protease
MKKSISSFVSLVIVFCIFAPGSAEQDRPVKVLKQQERYTLSVALQFSKKNRNTVHRVLTALTGIAPNAYATGFLVGEGLVMTCYHVISGKLSTPKRRILGFKPDDELEVKAFVNGCQAKIIKVDEDADLALLSVCGSSKQAQPGDYKMIRRGVFHGPYTFRGQQYWSVKTEGRDGFSGSPVYNNQGEVVGIFSGYDWRQEIAILCPGIKAQQFLADYDASIQPTIE